MPIPMEIPAKFLQAVAEGSAERCGCLLRDAATKRILGHLKEVGQLPGLLSRMPLPSVLGVGGVAQIGRWIDHHAQLKHIQVALDKLRLVSTVGAVASVAGLGVSVAGFAIVLNRLQRLESQLN